MNIDEIMGLPGNRRGGTVGFCGDRLHAERIEDRAGFVGDFHFFHWQARWPGDVLHEPLRIEFFNDRRAEQVLLYDWYPTHIRRLVKCHYVDYVETKTISREDVAICEFEITNHGPRDETINPDAVGQAEGEFTAFGRQVRFARQVLPAVPFTLSPGQSKTVVAATAYALAGEDLSGKLDEVLKPDSVARVIEAELDFYRGVVPEFHCEDALVEKIYYYRHYILRRNLARPAAGNLKHHVFYEGKQTGYARLITASASLAMDECRWWRDPSFGYGEICTCVENLPDHGLFRDLWVDRVRGLDWPGYEEWIPRAMADFLLVHPNDDLAGDVMEAGYRNIQGLLKIKDTNGNLMLNPGGHHMTQEHSPAFTHFHDYMDWYDYTDLERIEYQAFFYGSITGIARLMGRYGDPRCSELTALAQKVRRITLKAMWHDADRFFYAIREADGEPARCKEANGFLAFLFGLAPFEKPYTDIFDYFVSDRYFWNPYPIASCAKDVPSYTPHQVMWGNQKKKTGGTWSGPTWPYSNSLLVNVLSDLLRSGQPSAIRPSHLRSFFDLFTQGHLEAGQPMIRENWDGLDGHQRGCADYLHATYIDLVVRNMFGVGDHGPAGQLKPTLGLSGSIRQLPFDGRVWNVEVSRNASGTPVAKAELEE